MQAVVDAPHESCALACPGKTLHAAKARSEGLLAVSAERRKSP